MCDLNRFCRLCLREEGVDVKLFNRPKANDDLALYEKVKRCVPVQIELGDGLPSLICKICASLIEKIWNFRASTELVDTTIRQLLEERNATLNLEEKIKSIARGTLTPPSRARQCKKKSELEKLSPASCSTASESDLCNEALQNAILNSQPDSNDDWAETGLSLESPTSPQSLISGKEDEDLPLSKIGRKRLEYVCEFCGRKFSRSNHLAQHELTHTKEKPFHCSDCGKSFWYKASLIGHIKQTHTGDCNYTCELCGKGFFKKTELTRHKPTHSNETPHKCPQCGMGFKITKTLKRHIRNVHNAQRSHVCHTCGKSFIQLQTLKVHMVLHSGVKPYKCSYCGRGFAQSAPLKTHMRIHTGEKPYSCHVCQEAFSTRTALTSHAFKHKNVLPYPCTRCEASFRFKKDLVCHEQGHDDVEVRLNQCPNIKEEGSDGTDHLQSQLELTQGSEAHDRLEAVYNDDDEQLFDSYNPVENQPFPGSNLISCLSSSTLQQMSLNNSMSSTNTLHETYSSHHVDVPEVGGSQRHPLIHMPNLSNCCN
ncbi:zinc finger protein 2-like [Thrips palmi]|uniref:Zinc finger protein 2-like n=1 Tax=Thrips palmi TaxID=161013 RepID=A0A6P9A8N8_THRPL|nr:zinc finger protein 2-like [Thrips palmi]